MDNDQIAVIIVIVMLIVLIKGAIKTFKRNWIAALILLILLFPIWAIWAFFEIFTGEINPAQTASTSGGQTVNLNVVTNVSGEPARVTSNIPYPIGSNDNPPRIINEPSLSRSGQSNVVIDAVASELKQCAYCAESIKAAAKVCRYCNRDQ
jgi:hypothetical protein